MYVYIYVHDRRGNAYIYDTHTLGGPILLPIFKALYFISTARKKKRASTTVYRKGVCGGVGFFFVESFPNVCRLRLGGGGGAVTACGVRPISRARVCVCVGGLKREVVFVSCMYVLLLFFLGKLFN